MILYLSNPKHCTLVEKPHKTSFARIFQWCDAYNQEEEETEEDGLGWDCAVAVFSLTDRSSLAAAEAVLGRLAARPAILAGNKTDLVRTRQVTADGELQTSAPLLVGWLATLFLAESRLLAVDHDCKYVEVSAALAHNVDTLLVGITKQIRLKLHTLPRPNR